MGRISVSWKILCWGAGILSDKQLVTSVRLRTSWRDAEPRHIDDLMSHPVEYVLMRVWRVSVTAAVSNYISHNSYYTQSKTDYSAGGITLRENVSTPAPQDWSIHSTEHYTSRLFQ